MESVPAGPVLAKGGERKEGEWTEGGVRLRCRLMEPWPTQCAGQGRPLRAVLLQRWAMASGEGGDGVSWGGRWGGPSPQEPRTESAAPPAAGSKPLLPADVGGTSSLQCGLGT